MESLSGIFALLIIGLLYGLGFLFALIILLICSRNNNIKKRVYLVALAFFALASQHSCYYAADNFVSSGSNLTTDFYIIYLIASIWSMFLLRELTIMRIAFGYARVGALKIQALTTKAYNKAAYHLKLFYKSERERYERTVTRETNHKNIKKHENDS